MAVFNPGTPSIAPLYANIQDALNKRADIAGRDMGTMGAAAAAAAPVADFAVKQQDAATKAGMEAFKGSIEDQLNKNKSYYAAEAEGKTLWTQDDIDKMMKEHYPDMDPKYYPQIGKSGIRATPAEVQALGEHGEQRGAFEIAASQMQQVDPTKAAAMRVFRDHPTQLALLMGAAKLQKGTDEYGRDYFYNPMDPTNRTYVPTNAQTITDERMVTPKLAAPITKEQQALKAQLDPIQAQLSNIKESERILTDPNAKGIEQNRLLLQTARNAAGNVRNWKEVAVVSGNPDIFNQATKALNTLTEGKPLTDEDKTSLLNLIKYDRQKAAEDTDTFVRSAVARATVNAPLVSPDIIEKRIRASIPQAPSEKKTTGRNKVAVIGPNGETGLAYEDQKLPDGWKFK